jgi:hypothetical protein
VPVDIPRHKAKLKVSRASLLDPNVGLNLHVEVGLVQRSADTKDKGSLLQ